MDAMTSTAASNARDPQPYPFEFNGSGGEYFRIWIVNLLLTLVTFGIYGAWAKVRRLRYFYGSTVLAGSAFEYHGKPGKILKGRLIAVMFILPYYLLRRTQSLWSMVFAIAFLLALPFIIVQSRRFQTRMSSWRNIRFSFVGSYGTATRIYIGLSMLIPLTLGVLFPYVMFAKQRFIIGATRFGQTQFEFNARPGRYYAAFFAAVGWFLAALIALAGAFLLAFLLIRSSTSTLSGVMANPRAVLASPSLMLLAALLAVFIYCSLLVIFMVPSAVVHARLTNEAFGHTAIGTHQLYSHLTAKRLVWIYLSNILGIIFTAGLFSPWAKIRLLRYQLTNTTLLAQGSLDNFVGVETASVSAAGEELGDFLDVDFGL